MFVKSCQKASKGLQNGGINHVHKERPNHRHNQKRLM